jgi:hypothetical protein
MRLRLLTLILCLALVACSPSKNAPADEHPCGLDEDRQANGVNFHGVQHEGPVYTTAAALILPDPQPYLPADETVQLALQDPTLIGGVPAEIGEWPASVYAHTTNSACSSTIIGERVLLSAGHCMANGSTVSFTAGANKYKAVCEHHPEYKKNPTADWALCEIDRPVTGVTFERVARNLNVRVGDQVRLTGYGCVRPGGGGGNDGIFRIGLAKVTSIPTGKNFDVVTLGGAALCFGDSGGAAYFEYSDGRREIFGVNSRGNIKNVSYLPAVASSTMQDFMHSWVSRTGTAICGLTEGARACRDDKPEPPPSPKYDFKIRSKGACLIGKMNPGYESKKDSLVSWLVSGLAKFF